MPAGEAFTVEQRRTVERAIDNAQRLSGFAFSVFVGPVEGDPRAYAEAVHARLPDPATSVLVLVDPTQRALEIVTGSVARRDLEDAAAALAALSMQTAFAAGDLAGGLAAGINQLGESARRPPSLHTGT